MTDMNNKNISNLIGKPDVFTGERKDGKALLWIRQMQRIKKGLDLSDEQILVIIGSHLKGNAEEWWSIQEDLIDTWAQFVAEFKRNFANSELQTTMWWNELDNVEQRAGDTVDDVKMKMEQLCNNLNVDRNNELMIRKFYKALRKDLQYELDRDNAAFTKWEDITNEA
ncbi:hypothetical protein ABG067_008061, partial [Albugo candida]